MERKVLKASEGVVLTNGEIYGKTIYLSDASDESTFKEITQAEYEKVLEQEAAGDEDLHRCGT